MSDEPVVFEGQPMVTFRQLDHACAAVKGSSFRRFKRVRSALVEGRDFVQLDPANHAGIIRRLTTEGLAYPVPSSVVLLGPQAVERITGRRVEVLFPGRPME